MKKFLGLMIAVFMICLVFGPKNKDLEKARTKNGLELYTYYDGYTFCYEKEFPHRIYIEDKNMKFVWYKLRYVYDPIYKPYMYSDGIQSCLDLESYKTIPISNTESDKDKKNSLNQTYTNENEGFSFMYPDGWAINEESSAEFELVMVSSPYESMYTGPAATIVIAKGDTDEKYFSATMSDFEDGLLGGKNENVCVLSLDDILLSGHPTRKLMYTITSDNGVSLKQILYFCMSGSKMYVIGSSTYENLWDKYESIFEKIMDSCVITNTPLISSNMETTISDSRYTEETLEEIPFGYEEDENYTDYVKWGGTYDDGWLDTTLTFSLYSDGIQYPECGSIITTFRGMENYGKLYYLGGNQFQWENEGYYSSIETYYVCAVYDNGTYQLELYNSDGTYEVTFTLYEQYIP